MQLNSIHGIYLLVMYQTWIKTCFIHTNLLKKMVIPSTHSFHFKKNINGFIVYRQFCCFLYHPKNKTMKTQNPHWGYSGIPYEK